MKILLVKLSSLGDVVHTLPVVSDLRQALPDAEIDWVVEKSFAPVLAHSTGVRRVITCEIRRWRKQVLDTHTHAAWRAFKAQLQAERYDAVIDLQGLTKSAVVARLARLSAEGKRYALANRTEGSGYEAPTRWLADVAVPVTARSHAVQRGRELCGRALGYTPAPEVDYGLTVQPAASAPATVLLVHGTSRADKEWPLASWAELGRRLIAGGFRLALPHGSDAELATSHALAEAIGQPDSVDVWPRLPLDALTERMAACTGVVGVDSGLSHIAVALGLPHVQIYNFDTAWRTGPFMRGVPGAQAHQQSVYAQPAPDALAVWDTWQACLAASPLRPLR